MNRLSLLSILLAALSSTTFACCAYAQDTSSFYKGKTVTIEIGVPPGGSFDTYARLLSRHLGKHLPGAPTVIINNMPGAGSRLAAAYVARAAAKDGTYIAAVTASEPLDPILEDAAKLNYDPSRVNYLGSAMNDVFLCVVRRGAPATKFDDMLKTPVVMGGTQAGDEVGYLPILLNNLFGTKFKVVLGYPDTPSLALAMQSGEIDGNCGVTWTSMKSRYLNLIQSGQIKIVLQEKDEGVPQLNEMGIPLAESYVHDEQQRSILQIINSQEVVSRPYFVAEGVPADRLRALRQAFMETWRDPDTLSDAASVKLDIAPISGEEVQSLLQKVYANPPALLQSTRDALKAK
ncbi:MAG TPA: hypothetical protein VG271_17020 [Beijerinckiaceae bacterium]|nr:hypothetical protein [Beijerinckiaceae bacterium]